MIEIIKKYWYIPVAILVIGLVIGFFIGRGNVVTKEVVKYVKGETITKEVKVNVPVNVYIPAKPTLPTKPDTIWKDGKPIYIALKVDTAKIISEYINRKTYNPILFDDKENGKLSLGLVVQYNKLDSIGYEFTPIHKETTKIIERTFTPFINASYNSFGYMGAGVGIYYHNIGIGAKYITDFKQNGFEISGHIKF